MNLSHPSLPASKRLNAFSLIELLVVLAIIGVLAAFAMPAFTAIGQARGVTEAGYQIGAVLELARAEAIAQRTYVRAALITTNTDGRPEVRVGAVASGDGTSGTNDLRPVMRVTTLRDVTLTGSGLGNVTELVTGSPSGISFRIGRTEFGNGPVITFTPGGEAMTNALPIEDTGFTPRMGLGVSESRGNTTLTNNALQITIDGATGAVQVLRP
jgi:prepilin-type N-terminal cleavage/methylation domain-containing protein